MALGRGRLLNFMAAFAVATLLALTAGLMLVANRPEPPARALAHLELVSDPDDSPIVVDAPPSFPPSPIASPQASPTPRQSARGFELVCYTRTLTDKTPADRSGCKVSSVAGFSGQVTFFCEGLPPNSYCNVWTEDHIQQWVENTIDLSTSPSQLFAFHPGTLPGAKGGTYKITLVGRGGSVTKSLSFSWIIENNPDYRISCSPEELDIPRGSTQSVTCRLEGTGYGNEFNMTCNKPKNGGDCLFEPSQVRLFDQPIDLKLSLRVGENESSETFVVQYWARTNPKRQTSGSIRINVK